MKKIKTILILTAFTCALNAQSWKTVYDHVKPTYEDVFVIEQDGSTKYTSVQDLSNVYNIVQYGAVGDGSTDNTTAIQDAIDAAAANYGTVYIPHGVFKTGSLTVDYKINIVGDGKYSVLQSNAAEPLLVSYASSYMDGANGRYPHGRMFNFMLDGNEVGTIGIESTRMALFNIDRVIIYDFTDIGFKLIGSLIGEVNHCEFRNCPILIYADSVSNPVSQPNLVNIRNTQLIGASDYAVKWLNGSMLSFENCDFESNGTAADSTTGSIYFTTTDGIVGSNSVDFIGLTVQHCWFEQNVGNGIEIVESDVDVKFNVGIFNSTFFINTQADSKIASIRVTAPNYETRVFSFRNNFSDSQTYRIIGANAHVTNIHSNYRGLVNTGGNFISSIDQYGYLTPPSGADPGDTSTAAGWATIYVGGTEYRIKLYQ